jgi:glyoxylase-like metal-dependent hydrolase (beta-lactamase superfamily II)
MKFCLSVVCALAISILASHASAQPGAAQAEPRVIEQVRGDLYRVLNNVGFPQVTVFLVTPDGIILADPLNAEFSAWLRAELTVRFPDTPVRYVINSHYHWDHARGGGMFADTATFVAHENFQRNLDLPIQQARPPGDTDDVDGDNRLSREEAQTGTLANFDAMDGNGDGFLTQAEMAADIRRPDITFEGDRYVVELGGKRVELIHAGNRHTSDMIDLYFPDERVLFTGDYVNTRQLCCNFAFDRKPLGDWVASFRALETLDFDTQINCHGAMGTKPDFIAFRMWVENLAEVVAAGIEAGLTLAQMQSTITMETYRGWGGYDQTSAFNGLPRFIESAYLNLTRYGNN